MPLIARIRTVLTPAALAALAAGWLAVATVALTRPLWAAPPGAVLVAVLVALVAVISVCAFGVVTHAEHLARRLGDPYGTLILTLSIVVIEVILISAVMLGPGEHTTIARDSVMAVSMIILNLVIGLALVIGGLRHGSLRANPAGISGYLALLIVLLVTAFALPAVIGESGGYPVAQAVPVLVMTVSVYALFLAHQIGPRKRDFQEAGIAVPEADAAPGDSRATLARHSAEVGARAVLLVLTVLPIVVLSHDMASLLDDGLGRLGAPPALSGILIAVIVFLPETITTLRAAAGGEAQRVSNLAHGALVSTVGLTIPAVLVIGLMTGQAVVLAESPVNLLLLAVSLGLTAVTFLGARATAIHGAAHLMVFALYAIAVFS